MSSERRSHPKKTNSGLDRGKVREKNRRSLAFAPEPEDFEDEDEDEFPETVTTAR